MDKKNNMKKYEKRNKNKKNNKTKNQKKNNRNMNKKCSTTRTRELLEEKSQKQDKLNK